MTGARWLPGALLGALASAALAAAPEPQAAPRFECGGFAPASAVGGAGKIVAPAHLGDRVHSLVVFAGFEGQVEPAEGPPAYAARLFDRDRPGSLAHFYDLMSFGQFAFSGTVLPRRYAAKRPALGRESEIKPYGHFTRELLGRLDRSVDFGAYDNDGPDGVPNSGDDDGYVDYLFVNLRSVPRGFIAGGATGVAGLGFTDAYATRDLGPDGRPILVHPGTRHGAVVQEGSFSQTVGVMAHEFGHALGLPDLYDLDYDDPQGDSAGIGKWGLMGWGAHGWSGGDGPVGFSAWSLERLGWIGEGNGRLVEIGRPQEVVGEDPFAGGRVYKVHLPPRFQALSGSGTARKQIQPGYLLLESRRRDAHYYNRGLPGDGLLVWRVGSGRPGNKREEAKLVDLVCADGLYAADGSSAPGGGGDDLDYWAHDAAYREAHGGNLGDAGDLFDGVRRTRFGLQTNPSVHSVGGFAAAALAPLDLEVRRRQGVLSLRVTPPRWAGVIDELVRWAGVVLVDGDVEVAPAGQLQLYADTQVRFVSGDRSAGGLDPALSEIRVRGDLYVSGPINNRGHNISFARFGPGDRWYGLVVDPVPGANIDLPADDVALRDATRGVVLPGLGEGPPGLAVAAVRLHDGDSGVEAGNGDGRLAPGESARLLLDIRNPSLTTYHNLRLDARWKKGSLKWTFRDRQTRFEEFITVPPGRTQVELPPLMLDPGASPAQPAALSAALYRGRKEQWAGEIDLRDPGAPRPLDATLSLVGQSAGEGHIPLSLADRLSLRLAAADPEVVAAELVVYDRGREQVVAELPLLREGGRRYAAAFQPPALGVYDLLARVRGADGRVGFAPQRLQAAAHFAQWHPVLLVVNDAHGKKDWGGPAALVETFFARHGLKVNRIDGDQWPFIDENLLGRYDGAGAVVWFGQTYTRSHQQALAHFLRRQGRLLVSASQFFRFGSFDPDFKALVGFGKFKSPVTPRAIFRPGADEAWAPGRVFYDQLFDLVPAAQLRFVDPQGQPTGFHLDGGDYRLAYYGFDFWQLPADRQRDLVAAALDFLVDQPPPRLLIRDIAGIAALGGLEPLRPQIVIENGGDGPAPPFSLWFEAEGPVGPAARQRLPQAALAPGQRRAVSLPAWRAPVEGEYVLRFSLREDARGTLLYQAERPLSAVDVRGRFESQPVPDGKMGNGAAFFDFDGDDDLDLYVVQLAGANRLYRNDAGDFTETAAAAGLDDRNRGRGLAVGDYDSDGDLDLYLVNERLGAQSGANRFFANLGDGRFADAAWELDGHPHDAPLADAQAGRGAGFFDYDSDGDLDLYLVNAVGGISANRLYRNDAGLFFETAARLGLADAGDGRGLAIGDYDSDGDPDLYLANLSGGAGALWRNDVALGGRFHPVLAGLAPGADEVGAVFGDYDGDGDLDLFVSNQGAANALWRNEGQGRFAPTAGGRLGAKSVGAAFFDYDNDGDLDLATTALSQSAGGEELYHNRGGQLVPVGALLGLRRQSAGRGLSWGDYDGDGMQDLLIADAERTTLYKNRVAAAAWLRVELMGREGNVDALGARVALSAAGQTQVRELQSSYGYGSQVQPWLHFGLGGSGRVDSVRVFWPGGQQSLTTRIEANQRLVLSHPVGALKAAVPAGSVLGRSYPNPFNSQAVIPFELAADGRVRLEVFNLVGQRVRVLVEGSRSAGFYQGVWDGRDEGGRSVGSGVYFYRLQAGGHTHSRRMLLLR